MTSLKNTNAMLRVGGRTSQHFETDEITDPSKYH